MKKQYLGGILMLALLGTVGCDSAKKSDEDTADSNTRVVDRDSVATEYEVTETVVEYDTTKRKKTVSAEEDIEVKKDRD